MTTITQSIPSLGSPPLTTDPVNFDTRADTLYGTSLPAVITATNTWSGQANTVAGEVNTNATNAQTAANTATGASAAAIAAVNATQWVSGQAYLTGAVVWSPINYLSYRANTNTSGTTDPSISASWVSLNVAVPVSVANGGTGATTLTGVLRGNGTSAVTAGNVNLASEVTGTLPTTNGGTGLTALGTAGQVLTVNSGATALEYAGIPSGGFSNLTVLTSGTSYTVPAGVTKIKVTVTGGGGGGGGAAQSGTLGTNSVSFGSTGSAGATAIKIFTVTPGSVLSYTIGAGGAGGAAGNTFGSDGGNSTFIVGGTTVTAAGGGGGTDLYGNNGGIGGVATNGDINIAGGDGVKGAISTASNNLRMSTHQGGASFWGGGALGKSNDGSPALAARAYGAGGGSTSYLASSNAAGAAGFQGVITIEF